MASPNSLDIRTLPSQGFHWVKERLQKVDVFDETKVEQQKESPWYMLGSMYYYYWMIVLVTGVILVALYLPTTAQAYDSINVLSHNWLGSILRGMHKYAGDAMIIAGTLKVYRMWFAAEYKNKGEISFLLALILLVIAMYSGLTGYLLIWNQRAFWATKVFATFPTYLDVVPKDWAWPWDFAAYKNSWLIPNIIGAGTKLIGNLTHQGFSTSQILMGGSSIGQATMTRFYSLHFALSLILLVTSEIYFYQNRMKRINISKPILIILFLLTLFCAIVFPAESGTRSNPEVTPLPILSDWYFLALYQLLKYMDPYWATLWTVGIPFCVLILAAFDWGPERKWTRRPIFTLLAIMGAINFIAFSLLIIANKANIETDPPYWFGNMIFFITIGEYWHWGLYRQRAAMTFWVLFNLVTSVWYLIFWHGVVHNAKLLLPGSTTDYVFGGHNLTAWIESIVNPGHFASEMAKVGFVDPVTHLVTFNFTNVYWNLLWVAFSLAMMAVSGWLFWMQRSRDEARASQVALEGAPA